MNFYHHFYCYMITFLTLYKKTSGTSNKYLDVTEKGIKSLTPYAVGLVLFVNVNNTSEDVDFDVEVTPDQCCLDLGTDEDCNVMEIIGECIDNIPRGTRKTLRLVAPLIETFERRGFCTVYLNSKPKVRQRKAMRNAIRIPFDTRLKSVKGFKNFLINVSLCNGMDEDPFNDCEPVDCESYYNGKRSYYDNKRKRCVNVPICISDIKGDIPNVIYDKNRNKCINGETVTEDDLKLVKELTKDLKPRKTKDILIIKNQNNPKLAGKGFKNISKIDNRQKIFDSNQNLMVNFDTANYLKQGGLDYFITKYFVPNRCTLTALGVVVLVQCCLICTMVYYLSNTCTNCRKKKVCRTFFNYRQDASVTTPLIGTSNIDTETTDYQYFSESSNIEKRIKCYKACQKERKNNVMSDDILSKCLTRRDWNSKPARSEAIPESINSINDKELQLVKQQALELDKPTSILNQAIEPSKKTSNAKVNFENEKPKPRKPRKPAKTIKNVSKKIDNKKGNYEEMQGDVSEKEIKCHNYNYVDMDSNVTGFKRTAYVKKLGFFRSDKKPGPVSISMEKGAQAVFSNDSLDDFLSERGMIFLAGEELSKCSFSSRGNNGKGSISSVSSKTSKNNVLKNVLSVFQRKSRHGPASDPGEKTPDTNMEILHMSHVSEYSSSNHNSNYIKTLRKTNNSRSSL